MITNYIKYIYYTGVLISIIIFIFWCNSAIQTYKNNIIEAFSQKIAIQQKDITIAQQNNVIEQSDIVFKKSQEIVKKSKKIEKDILLSETIEEKIKIKNNLIDRINCVIDNFNDETLCQNS